VWPTGARSFKENEPPEYIIAVDNETGEGEFMGKFVGQTESTITINPWNFLHGGIDWDKAHEMNKQDFVFLSFDTIEEMDLYMWATFAWEEDDEKRQASRKAS